MSYDRNTASLQSLLRYALPFGTNLVAGDAATEINWAVMVRAQPPAFPDIEGGELALVSMDILRSYDNRIQLGEIVDSLAQAGVDAIAVDDRIPKTVITLADQHRIALLQLPKEANLSGIERAVNKAILNHTAQLTERALEIQRQLTRLVSENRDIDALLQVMARTTAKPVVLHDQATNLIAQAFPTMIHRGMSRRSIMQNLPFADFQAWLQTTPNRQSQAVESPLGLTATLYVEKKVAAYLSILALDRQTIDEFDDLVLSYSADVCALELAKTRAIESAVEQARPDWIQMWLSGTSSDDELLLTRAQQSGFDTQTQYVMAVFKATTITEKTVSLASSISFVQDDLNRRQVSALAGQYLDFIVILYGLDTTDYLSRIASTTEEIRQQLTQRSLDTFVLAGISRPYQNIRTLREAYREAKDAMNIAQELGERETTTVFGDLKLYRLLLAIKEINLDALAQFHDETIAILIEHDMHKQSEFVRTLIGFFEANGNLAQAAKQLDVHRNTLVYRLERISELTGLTIDDPDNRLILHLALKIKQVIATISEHKLS